MIPRIPPPGRHGGDGPRVAAALGVDPGSVLDLSASLNPVAPDPSPVVARHLEAIGVYPDPAPATAALAAALGVDADRIVLTNGGAEAIALVAAEAGSGSVEEPDFSLYRRHLGDVSAAAPRWRSDPHNPSGRLAPPEERAAVWDEAFYPLATGRWTSGRADSESVVLGSLTKVFACPGLRLGFVLCPPGSDLPGRISARQPMWAVNGLAAAALPDLLAIADLPGWAAEVARLRSELAAVLASFGLPPEPSDANFVLVRGASGLRDALAPNGVIVRDCASFGLPGHVRIAVPDDAGRRRLAAALEAWRASSPGGPAA
jgi:histidinol-phosphate/aromatic aminotransferase/cobyric acid decarboxylase-like protein